MAWGALVPLFLAVVRSRRAAQAACSAYLGGIIFFAGSCPWIDYTIHRYGGVPAAVASLVFVLFIGLAGASFALFGLLGFWLSRGTRYPYLPMAFLWTAIELLRTVAPFDGFPWNLLGYSQVDRATFGLAATITGIYGPGFLIALVNALLASAIHRFMDSRGRLNLMAPSTLSLLVSGMLAGLVIGGAYAPYSPPAAKANLETVMVQPDTSLDRQWSYPDLQAFLRDQKRLSLAGLGPTPSPRYRLILWPEQPAPLTWSQEPELRTTVTELARTTHSSILLDETAIDRGSGARAGEELVYNSALLVTADGLTAGRYDKIKLVPFGEYVPLPEWMIRWFGIGKLTRQVGDFLPGQRAVVFTDGNYHFGAIICYESIFPDLARREVEDGAQWLVNLSDDGWYGHSSAQAQSLTMARARAIENRRWMLRDTNDGYTGIIDPYGRVLSQLARGTQATLAGQFSARDDLTFYTRHGDWFPIVCVIIVVVGAAARLRRRIVPRIAE
jgi:apolipoprotein N-acyltransferase